MEKPVFINMKGVIVNVNQITFFEEKKGNVAKTIIHLAGGTPEIIEVEYTIEGMIKFFEVLDFIKS